MTRNPANFILFTAAIILFTPVCRAAEEPGAALERLGARTGKSALAVLPNSTDERVKYQSENPYAYVVIGTDWKGGVEGLKYLKALTGLRGVMFSNDAFGDEWCECLRGKTDLKELYLQGERFTDVGAAALKDLKELEALSLLGTKITDVGMKNLKGMKHLKWLALVDSFDVSDEGFAYVPVKELRWLNLDCSSVSGDSMARLKAATKLEWLRESAQAWIFEDDSRFRMVDAGLKHLKGMKHLRHLSLGDMPATEKEMKAVLADSTELPYIEFTSFDPVYTRKGFVSRDAIETAETILMWLADIIRESKNK